MRLFIAIDLPENVKDYLRRLQALLPDASMSKTHDFHLTLKFLGSCDEAGRKKVEEELKQIKFSSFEASLGELGVFGGKMPRVVWIGLNTPAWLADTSRDMENRMGRLGFEKENRFVPHITLCRVKFAKDPAAFLAALKKLKIEPLKFNVHKFYLFESKLSSKGAVHEKLKEFLCHS